MRAVFGVGHKSNQFERGLGLIEERLAWTLRQQLRAPESDIPWLTALLGGLIAGGIRFALQDASATAAEMTERTLRLIRPLQDLYGEEPRAVIEP